MWEKVLRRVWGETEGWVATAAITKDKKFQHRFYRYPEQMDLLVADTTGYSRWASVYFCPSVLSAGKLRKPNVKRVQALWIDKDKGSLHDIKPRPTICWQTSEGKHQAIWLLAKPEDPQRVEAVNRYLAYKLKADTSAWNLNQLLRVPGTVNYKYDPPQPGLILWDDGPTYNLDDLSGSRADMEMATREITDLQGVPPLPDDLPDYRQILMRYGAKIPASVWEMLQTIPHPDEDWSDGLWKLERGLLEAGLTPEEVFVIVQDSSWNKYERDKRPEGDLWRDVYKAAQKKGVAGRTSGEWSSLGDMLAYEFRPEWMVDGMWMEGNVGWIAGVGKSYKSVISLDLALSVAAGVPFLGQHEVMKPGPVLMVQEEDPKWRVANRLRAMCSAKGLMRDRLTEGPEGLILDIEPEKPVPLYLKVGTGFSFTDEESVNDLERMILDHKPQLVVLDPWFMLTPSVDENKAGEVATILNRIKGWRNDHGCAVAVVHHFRKGSGSAHERLFGSQVLYAWSENSLWVSRARGSQTAKIERDIKDSVDMKALEITFDDIDKEYLIRVDDMSAEDPRVRIIELLKSVPEGTTILRKEIIEATGIREATISDWVKDLHEKDCVTIEYRGRGGQMHVTTLAPLYKIGGEGIDLTDM